MNRTLSVAVTLSLLGPLGCGPGEPAPAPLPTLCTLEVEGGGDIELTQAVGRSITVSFIATPGAEIGPPTVGAGVEVTLGDLDGDGNGSFDAWIAYDAPEVVEIGLELGCAGGDGELDNTATGTVEIVTRRPRWSAQPSWTPGDDGPPGREYFAFWRDPDDEDTAFVFGGFHYEPVQFTIANDLWSYNLNTGGWNELENTGAPLQAGGGFALGADGRGLYYGGLAEDAAGNFDIPFALHTIAPDAAEVFSPVSPSGAPASASYQPALLYDAARERFITVGGQGLSGTHLDVAAYAPAANTWSSVDTGGLDDPDGRTGFFWAWDAPTERLIVFSGERGGGQGGGCNCAQDTWALELGEDPPRWSLIDDGSSGPPGRRNGAYALDPVGHRLLVWGGTNDGATTQPGLWALRLDRGKERWDEVPTESDGDGPAIRSSGGMIYDEARDRMVVGFGNDSIVGARNDLWSLAF